MVQILNSIEEGTASQATSTLLDVCDRILGKAFCPLGDAAAMPVASYVDKFRSEFQEHLDSGCPMHGSSSLEGILAPVDQHSHAPGEVFHDPHRPFRPRPGDCQSRLDAVLGR